QRAGGVVDLDEGDVVVGIGADDGGRQRLGARRGRDRHLAGAAHDVGVGQDVAVRGDDDAGAFTGSPPALGHDVDHRRLDLGQDALHVEGRSAPGGGGGAGARRRAGTGRRGGGGG